MGEQNTMPVKRQDAGGDMMAYDDERPAQGRGPGAAIEIAQTRAAQEVQAAIIMAKRFPRDQVGAFNAIIDACKRKSLAAKSQYAYPRGNETVSGPSIRLAEVMAQNWGNLDFGIVEVEQRDGESTMCAYCWDQQTNVRQTRIFTVKHERHTRRGTYRLTDPRDIYELCANQGARRLRACILGVIPADVVEAAIEQCDKTLAGDTKEPLVDRARKMVKFFEERYGVTATQIEKRLGHRLDAITETELITLRKIATSLQDNMASVESFFPPEQAQADPSKPATQALADRLADRLAKGKEPEQAPKDEPEASGSEGPVNPEDEVKAELIESIKASINALGSAKASPILIEHGFDGTRQPSNASIDQLQALLDAMQKAMVTPPATETNQGELLPGYTTRSEGGKRKRGNPERFTR